MTRQYITDRRRLLARLGAIGLGLIAVPFARTGADAARPGGLTAADLARKRKSYLPEGGTYDHATQQMKGYEVNVAGTSTGKDEDQCCQSTTFWDGERD
jgi:hypothetical protein